MLPLPNPEDWVTVAQAARILGVTKRTIVRWSRTERRAVVTNRRMVAAEPVPVLPIYVIGETCHLVWRPHVDELAAARRRTGAL